MFARNLPFAGLLFCTLSVAGCSPSASSPGPKTAISAPSTKASVVIPSGTFAPKLTRKSGMVREPIAMSDDGSVICTTENSIKGHHYSLLKDETEKMLDTVPDNVYPQLTPDGRLVDMVNTANLGTDIASNSFHAAFRISAPTRNLFENDGSLLMSRLVPSPGSKTKFRIVLEKHTREPIPSSKSAKDVIVSSRVLYESGYFLAVCGTTDNADIWFREHHQSSSENRDVLMLCKNGKVETVDTPKGYSLVRWIAQTKGAVIGTFGPDGGPTRAFRLDGKDWKELPIPDGFSDSYVTAVLNDGTVIGFVTDGDPLKQKQVAWRGDKVAILNDLDGWPRATGIAVMIRAARNGDLLVEDVIDPEHVKGDYYLLHLGP
ncbi:MAG: hypothetical protein JST12_06770 [Armatimonadetes bacterium]|nr:hypothetical protein [Armatimonadota bacterium]